MRAEKDTEIKLRRVNAAFGQRQHRRTQNLFARKVVSTNDMDERKTEAELAGIQLRQAIDNKEIATLELARSEEVLKRRTIKSPISGVVMERFKTIGEYVDEQPVLRVAQLDPLHVEVFVPVEQLGDIRPGMRAEVWSDAVNGSTWKAKVTRVDKVADVASGTYGVRLELPNPDYQVPAGLRCRLAFDTAPVLPVAEQPADDGSDDVVAVKANKRPAPVEPSSDVSGASDISRPVDGERMADASRQAIDEGVREVVIAQALDKAASSAQQETAGVAEPTPAKGQDEPRAEESEQAVDGSASVVSTAAPQEGAAADQRERALAEDDAEAAASLVDDESIVAPTAEMHIVATEPAEPVIPPLGGLPKVQAVKRPEPKGFFDKIVAMVTDQPAAKTTERRSDADRGERPANTVSDAPPAIVNERSRDVSTSDAMAGRVDNVAPIVRNQRRTEVNTRDALTGRINLELPPKVVDETASVCVSAGPYDKEAVATAQASRLRDAGLNVNVEPKTTSVGIGYRVLSAPLDTLSDARAAAHRLKQAGVKDFYVAGSKPPFHVMLGSYSSAAAAKRRIKHMARVGIEADKQPWKRDLTVYSLQVFGTPTANAEALLTQLPVPPDGTPPAHCEQLASR